MQTMIMQAIAEDRAKDMQARAAVVRRAREARQARRVASARGAGILSRRRAAAQPRRSSAAAANS
jgi:hypothetical protein